MNNKSIEMQAKEYVYNLKNCANEYGFNAHEGWTLVPVTDYEKLTLEKKYYPTLTIKVLPEQMADLLRVVRERLRTSDQQQSDTDKQVRFGHSMQHVVAFNPKLLR